MVHIRNINRKFKFELPSVWEIIIYLLLFYTFFFQNAVKEINGALIILNVSNILFGAINNRKSNIFFNIPSTTRMLVFVFVTVASSIIFGVSSTWSIHVGFRMIEYALSSICIIEFYLFHKDKIKRLFFVLWLSILLLLAYVWNNGSSVYYDGAIGIDEVNSNAFSSYILLMIFCSFYLFIVAKGWILKSITIASIVFATMAMIKTASRRGFIILLILLAMVIIFSIIPRYSKKQSINRLILYILLGVVACFGLYYISAYVLNSTTLGLRLSGKMTGGDIARKTYQAFALKQFIDRPLFGVGLGGIQAMIGHYSHSMYYELLSCTGVVGSIIFISLIVKVIKMIIYTRNKLNMVVNHNDKYMDNKFFLSLSIIYFLLIILSGYSVVMIYEFYFYLSISLICLITFTALDNNE